MRQVVADFAHVGGRLVAGLREIRSDLAALDEPGFWAVAVTFEGAVTCARFGDVRTEGLPAAPWRGPARSSWTSSLDRARYVAAVADARRRIATGAVYQVNVCRVLRAPTAERSLLGLAGLLARRHPSRYPALISLPSAGIEVCSASPELFLRRRCDRIGDVAETGPIKGTGRTASDITDKDRAENVMIVDMARNDLGQVAETGGVTVSRLCELEAYPGSVHLVSTVRAKLAAGVSWPELFAATFPPASVSGAPKSSALQVIRQLEPVPRGPYCGAVGYVDNRVDNRVDNSADNIVGNTRGEAVLAVGIRTFWLDADELCFGAGAGITWGSDPSAEWAETELKASRLIALASDARDG